VDTQAKLKRNEIMEGTDTNLRHILFDLAINRQHCRCQNHLTQDILVNSPFEVVTMRPPSPLDFMMIKIVVCLSSGKQK
jgi:hypothetical protein